MNKMVCAVERGAARVLHRVANYMYGLSARLAKDCRGQGTTEYAILVGVLVG